MKPSLLSPPRHKTYSTTYLCVRLHESKRTRCLHTSADGWIPDILALQALQCYSQLNSVDLIRPTSVRSSLRTLHDGFSFDISNFECIARSVTRYLGLALASANSFRLPVLGPVVIIRMTLSTLTLVVPSIYQSSDPRLTLALNLTLNLNTVTAAADEECFAVNCRLFCARICSCLFCSSFVMN